MPEGKTLSKKLIIQSKDEDIILNFSLWTKAQS